MPTEGPAIIAPNHFSFLDHFFVAVYMRRKVHFMAKSQLFKRPLQFIYTHGGVFPVRRGHRDEEAFKTAHAILGRGDMVVMYAEGGRSRTGELGEAKPGIGRLALETGAAVVPTAIVGTERARNWKRLQFPKVTSSTATRCASSRSRSPRVSSRRRRPRSSSSEIKELHGELPRPTAARAIAAARAGAPRAPAGRSRPARRRPARAR